jgi:hypothetical protein
MKRAASQHMNMKVENRLSRPGAVVNHGAIALRFQPTLARELGRHKMKVAQQALVLRLSIRESDKVLSREHQQVDRGLGVNILERHHSFVLMNNLGRNLAVNDLAKQAVSH